MAIGNRDSAIKGHVQNLTCSQSQLRGSSLKGSWSDVLAKVGEPLEDSGGN